jgi:hypothetical protein
VNGVRRRAAAIRVLLAGASLLACALPNPAGAEGTLALLTDASEAVATILRVELHDSLGEDEILDPFYAFPESPWESEGPEDVSCEGAQIEDETQWQPGASGPESEDAQGESGDPSATEGESGDYSASEPESGPEEGAGGAREAQPDDGGRAGPGGSGEASQAEDAARRQE